jgi:intracellular sulfur oxidation DsrE/DsrF family protein
MTRNDHNGHIGTGLITPRRGFLARAAAASLALGFTGSLALPARDARAEPGGRGADDVENWPGALTGKHRQVFDAVSPNEGFSLVWSHIFLLTNAEASRIPESELNDVVVLRHGAAVLAFTDPVWKKYRLGEMTGVKDPATKAPAQRNPFFHPRDGDLPFPQASLDKLLARGATIGVCNVALGVLSSQRASVIGVTPEDARKEWEAHVIPGITIVPSGVWAVNRAQEHGCSYCYAG